MDGWPKNKNICTRLFEECEANLPEDPEGEQGVLINPPTGCDNRIVLPQFLHLPQMTQNHMIMKYHLELY